MLELGFDLERREFVSRGSRGLEPGDIIAVPRVPGT